MNGVDLTLLVLVLALVSAAAARRVSVPMPVVLATAGIAVGIAWRLAGLPEIRVPPQRVLFVFLPPLLTSAAYALPLAGVRRNARAIGVLAIGLVLTTMVAAAVVTRLSLALPWAVAFALGAIVAPPDPVAATTVATRTGLSHRLVVILEGEGLVNDATAIVAYHLAVDPATTGHFTWTGALLTLAREAPMGVLAGLVVGWLVTVVRRRLDDATLEAGISLLAPYLTYEIADRIQGSGVLAVVTLGFMLQRHRTEIGSPAVRIATNTVWAAVRFVTSVLVFFLLGVFIAEIVIASSHDWSIVAPAAMLAGVVVGLRLGWMFAVPPLLHALAGGREPLPSRKELTVLGWAGMRGVVSLALALAFPTLPGTSPAGETRHTVILLTFGVILVTLLVQGGTIAPLITWLGIGDPRRDERDEARVRARARLAGAAAVARSAREDSLPAESCRALTELVDSGDVGIASAGLSPTPEGARRALECALDAQRRMLDHMRDLGRVGESLAEQLATEIDADVTRVRGEPARITGEDVG